MLIFEPPKGDLRKSERMGDKIGSVIVYSICTSLLPRVSGKIDNIARKKIDM